MTEKIKVAYIGDSPYINSGFGIVAKAILSRLPRDIFELHGLGTMYQFHPRDIEPFDFYMATCIHDLMGFKTTIDFLQASNPDVLFMIADPGTMRSRFQSIMMSGRMQVLPAVTYFPLEGAPFNPHIIEQARFPHGPVTYTKWGQDEMAKHGLNVDYVWHGADHAEFRKYDSVTRERLKTLIGWGDKFVVGMVGMNKRSNRQPAMIEAAHILKKRGRKDFVIYLHCQEAGEALMAGWELGWMIDAYEVGDVIQLKPRQEEHKYIARPRTGTLEMVLERPLPENAAGALANLADLDFVSLLNMFDIYLDPASAHGFNLPAAESARCGVPIVTVNDGFARTEIYGDCAFMMQPQAVDYWHTGAWLPLVSPERIADTIEMLWDSKELRETIANDCKVKFDGLKWQSAADLFTQKFIDAHEFGELITGQK